MGLPATVSVPLRAGPILARASYRTWPLPVPCAPSITEIHSTSLRAVHEHRGLAAVTVSVRCPPPALIESLFGLIVNAHGVCVITIAWPAIVKVPVRAGPLFGRAS